MFGRLPRLHRDLLVAIVLVTCTALGAYAIYATPLTCSPRVGAAFGMVVGLTLAYACVHPSRRAQPRPVRVRHHR